MTDEIKLYSARPFIAYAGPDPNGYRQEVLVNKGVGNVVGIDDRGKTAQIEIDVPQLEHHLKGWINTDTDAFRTAQEQFNNGQLPVAFRIEHQRRKANTKTKAPIPVETPIYELMGADKDGNNKDMQVTNANTRKLMVAIGLPDGELHFSQELTDPAEDPQFGQTQATSARVNKTSTVNNPNTVNTNNSNVIMTAGPSNEFEATPSTALNPDGNANPGSYSVNAPIDLYFWLIELEADGVVPALPDARRRILAKSLLGGAAIIQSRLYDDELPIVDREVGSFKTIINTMKKVIKDIHPFTEEDISSKEAMKGWVVSIENSTIDIVDWAIKNANEALTPQE